MPRSPKRPNTHTTGELEVRHQEVFRAYRELAAYFRGRRTEREARGALKIIKAFVRDRERMNPTERRPLVPDTASKTAPRHRKNPSPSKKISRRRRVAAESKPVPVSAAAVAGEEPPADQ